jgi:nucleoside phosphorylase
MTASSPLFLVPLRIEAAAVGRGARGAEIDQLGMGPERTKASVRRVLTDQPAGRPIVVIGVGGGLVAQMAAGDVVVADSVSRLGTPERFDLTGSSEVAQRLSSAGLSVRTGGLVSSEAIVHGDTKRHLASLAGAVVVDMEAFWCEPLIGRHPLCVVRVLIDTPGRDLVSWRSGPAAIKAYRSLVTAARTLQAWSPVSVGDNSILEVGDI